MPRILFLDPVGGVAGDMLVAALLDLGAPLDAIAAGLDTLGFGPIPVRREAVMRGALAAARFVVEEPEEAHHHHRDHAGIAAHIAAAPLSGGARRRALAVFARLAEAEGKVHGVPAERVHFHEVGAVDSIADIVGAAIALDALQVERIVVGPLPLGGGFVDCAHGRLPLPAPATVALLEGWPVRPAPTPGEWVTPTGAALVTALGEPGELPAMRLLGVGHGAGSREGGPVPNVLRALLGEEQAPALGSDEVEVLAAVLDDMPGEWFPPLQKALFAAGALDVTALPGLGKKGRPALQLTVLAPPALAEAVATALLLHSATLGVRHHREARWVLARRSVEVETPWGRVRIKLAAVPGRPERPAPEHEDCAALASAAGVPVGEVYRAALVAWERRG
ncbi:MAG: nickel pincer cofactor biosynthesis protein LarC [Pseudomonadota bacterium]